MEQYDDLRHVVQLDEIPALSSKLIGAQEVAPADAQRTPAAGHIEAIVPMNVERVAQELVRCLLEASV